MEIQKARQDILEQRDHLATLILERHLHLKPDTASRYDARLKERCLQDVRYHLTYLAEAFGASSPEIFTDYVLWARAVLVSRGVPVEELSYNLKVMHDVCVEQLSGSLQSESSRYIELSIKALRSKQSGAQLTPLSDLARPYLDALLKGDRQQARELIKGALERGCSVKSLYIEVFQSCQYEVGRLWQENKITVAHEHYCTAATQLIMAELYPYVVSSPRTGKHLIAAAVAGEVHEMGVRMVADFFEMDGWDTYFVGANTPIQSLVQLVIDRKPHMVALAISTALNLGAAASTIEQLRALPERPLIMLGGQLINTSPGLWRELGADWTALSAGEAVARGNELVVARR